LKKQIFLSVIIPVYNEERNINNTLKKITSYIQRNKWEYEIIVVDDGSKDSTRKIVEDYKKENSHIELLRNRVNKGKGYAVKRGMLEGTGQYLLFLDADLSTPIEEIQKLLKWLGEGYDIAIGSRALPDSEIEIHQPWYREAIGRIFNLLVQGMGMRGIKDTQCGFKCFKKAVAHDLFRHQKIDGLAFDVEILFSPLNHNYKIKEVPVHWINSPITRVPLICSSFQMLRDLIRIKINNWKKRYQI